MCPRNTWKRPKNLALVNYRRFSSYKSAVVNYHWGHLSILHVFLGSFYVRKAIFLGICRRIVQPRKAQAQPNPAKVYVFVTIKISVSFLKKHWRE